MDSKFPIGKAPTSTFNFIAGSFLVLPEEFRLDESRHAAKNPDTPMILTAYREKDTKVCHFAMTFELLEHSKRVGIFVPENVATGDVLRLTWVDQTCAGAIYAPEA